HRLADQILHLETLVDKRPEERATLPGNTADQGDANEAPVLEHDHVSADALGLGEGDSAELALGATLRTADRSRAIGPTDRPERAAAGECGHPNDFLGHIGDRGGSAEPAEPAGSADCSASA